jgi:hypothetical protein
MNRPALFGSTLICLSLVACAGRAPQPVAVVQPMDNSMTCSAMMAEVGSNNAKITELGSEKGAKVAQNVAAGVVGLVVWPVWFLMDFQGAAGTEIKALQDRNAYLATKVNEEACSSEPETRTARAAAPPPAAYSPQAPAIPAAPPPVQAQTVPVYDAPPPPPVQPAPAYTTPAATASAYEPPTPAGQPEPVRARAYAPPTHGTFDPYAIDPYPTAPALEPM